MNRMVSVLLLGFSLMMAMAAYGQEDRAAESFTLEAADGEVLNLPANRTEWESTCSGPAGARIAGP